MACDCNIPVHRGAHHLLLGVSAHLCLSRFRRALWDTAVIGVALHSGGVTELRLQKPVSRHTGFRTFSGKAGQYCYLNIPELSRYQWHPFSLTSGWFFFFLYVPLLTARNLIQNVSSIVLKFYKVRDEREQQTDVSWSPKCTDNPVATLIIGPI